jgi:hypothetical protein
MSAVLLAADPAPLSAKLAVACLAGSLPAILSGRLRADGKILAGPSLTACAVAAGALHSILFEEPGVIAAFLGLVVGFVVFVLAPSRRASLFAAATIALAALMILGIAVFLRMPPREMRSAIARLRQRGAVVGQSDNPGTTYRDAWSVTFEHAAIDDTELLALASDLRALPKLWLTLSNCPISERGLGALANADNLVWLDLDGTQISDAGLMHLSNLSRLERVDLHNSRVSDDGLRSLSHLRDLQSLRLDGTAVTESGVEELQKSLPNCTIIHSDRRNRPVPFRPSAAH